MSLSIGIVSREFPPFFGGGIGTYTEQIARALADGGHRVVVITVSVDGVEKREERDGFVVVRLPFLDGDDWSGPHPNIATPESRAAFTQFSPVSVFAMQVARALPALVDEFGLEAVESPDTGALAWFALNERRLGRSCGRRGWPAFITHLHSPTAWIEHWDRAPQVGRAHLELKRMERDVVRWADGVVCPSRSLAVWAEAHFELERGAVEVIRHPLGAFEDAPERNGVRGDGVRRVVYAGRLEPRKGVDVLLAGFARAVEAGADLRLDLAGRDIHDVRTGRPFGATCLERLVPAGIRERVAVHGPVPPGALMALRRAGDLAAAPAPNDNFPYSCVEAMASGLPVVAARAGGMAEMISGDGDGLLFEPGDVEGCAGALRAAARMSGEQLNSMGRAARARIGLMCGTRGVVNARVAHFERVISRAARDGWRGGEDAIVTIGLRDGDVGDGKPLADAVRASAGFALGWVRDGEEVIAFGTPTLAGLAAGPRRIGPVAASRAVLAHIAPGFDWLDPWEVAVALAEAGAEGVVVPDYLTESSGQVPPGNWPHAKGDAAVKLCMELGPAMVAGLAAWSPPPRECPSAPGPVPWQTRAEHAEAQLSQIHASRGWRWLSRVYALLHLLRGRARPGTPPERHP